MVGRPDKEHVAEYAKSGRASCRKCKGNIAKDTLRMGKFVQSPSFDGWVPQWFHVACFFGGKKAMPDVSDIAGISELSFDDQKRIKDLIGGNAVASESVSQPAKKGQGGTKGAEDDEGNIGDYKVEIAKSSRSECRGCESKIEAGELRMGRIEAMDRRPFIPTPKWHHLDCLFKDGIPEDLKSSSDIIGFSMLDSDHQAMVREKMGEKGSTKAKGKRAASEDKKSSKGSKKAKTKEEIIDLDEDDDVPLIQQKTNEEVPTGKKKNQKEAPIKKKRTKDDVAVEDDDVPLSKMKKEKAKSSELDKDEKAIKAHSDKLFAIRTALKDVPRNLLKEILDHNDVDSRGGEVVLQSRCADVMLHGVPGDCPKCQGRLKYEDGMYKCTNWTEDGFAKCQFSDIIGERKAFKMPKDMGHDYLDNFKFVKVAIPRALIREHEAVRESVQEREKQRLMQAEKELASVNKKRAMKEEEVSDPSTCLKDMVFMLHSTKNYRIDFDEWSKKIKSAGGSAVKSMTKSVTHVLTTSGAHTAGGSAIKEAVKRKLPVVKLEFVEASIASGKRLSEQPYLLSGEATEDPEKKRSSQSKTVKIMVKGKGAVDVESGLGDDSHILEVKDNVYSATLNRTDISQGLNSYYVLQIIESDDFKTTHLFRKWGRIGVESKGSKLEKFSKDVCVREFEKLFYEKTGNHWQDRTPDRFVQQPGRFAIMEIGITVADEHEAKLQKDTTSKLPPTVSNLIQLIFDIDMMRKSMLEMEIDLDKMPLGALSRKQIQRGYTVLTEIQNVLDDPNLDDFDRNQKILSCTNQFYTIVPQNFGLGGMTAVHRIDSHEKLKEKLELVESLLEMEIAVSLQKEGDGDDSPIDANYKRLKTEIKPISQDDERWRMVNQYLKNTHAATHSKFTTELMDLFEIEREGEKERFSPFAKDPNRKLLWHGSRMTNWVGILSQGLRIAPPEAPVTGYMFGKGVYFADMSSKSANYCNHQLSNNEGLLMLSEVALGKSHELTAAKETLPKGLPKDCISVKGCGKTAPDPKASFVDENGVEIPYGKGTQMYGVQSSLLYNEFIVYNVNQIKTKYLLRVKFNVKK